MNGIRIDEEAIKTWTALPNDVKNDPCLAGFRIEYECNFRKYVFSITNRTQVCFNNLSNLISKVIGARMNVMKMRTY